MKPAIPTASLDRFIALANEHRVAYDVGWTQTNRPPEQWGYRIKAWRGGDRIEVGGPPAACYDAALIFLEMLAATDQQAKP